MFRLVHWLRTIYDFFIRHWLFTAFLVTIPAYWFIIIELQGQYLGLVDANGTLSPLANIVFWSLFALSLVITLVKAIGDKYNEEAKFNGQLILEQLLSSTNSVVERKKNRFLGFIARNQGKRGINPFSDITRPKRQIDALLGELQICLANIFSMGREQIGVSLIYRTSNNRRWDWAATINVANDIPLEELLNERSSTSSQILIKKVNTIFFADKREGIAKNQYYAGPLDNDNGGIGSILCKKIIVRNRDTFVEAILSITTYGVQICDSRDSYTEEKLLRVVVPPFESRICLELALLYMVEGMAISTLPDTN